MTTINPESEDYFKTLDKGGGPTEVFYSFQEAVEQVFSNYWEANDYYGSFMFESKPIERQEKGEIKV